MNTEKWLNYLLKNVFRFGSEMYLITDLNNSFLLLPAEDLEDHIFTLGTEPVIILRLNPILKSVYETLELPFPEAKIDREKNDWKKVVENIKRRIKTNPHQKLMLLIRSGKVVNMKAETDQNLDIL